jgi:hypothetical protein
MSVREAMVKVLASPSAKDLWKLRAELLQAGIPANARPMAILGEFQRFLDHLATGTSSREYSELASKLDIGAVGGVVLEQMLESKQGEDLALRLFTGALSEGLMVLATRQHIRAWEGELAAVYREASWFLYGELWRWAESKKPELPAPARRELLDRLISPVLASGEDGVSKALLLGLLFQMLLLSALSDELWS